jgi:hypothetical protein
MQKATTAAFNNSNNNFKTQKYKQTHFTNYNEQQ